MSQSPSSPPPNHGPAPGDETPSQKVFNNSLLLDNVYAFLGKRDLTRCLLLQREGFECAVKALYRVAPPNVGWAIVEALCSPVSPLHQHPQAAR